MNMNNEKTFSGDESFTINCTGDACVGDNVRFSQAKFGGSWKSPTFLGHTIITGKIVKDSYGKDKQQHTFTLLLPDGNKLRIKGRNLYANSVYRMPWADESDRQTALNEKHARGDVARADRDDRRQGGYGGF